jgi:hypothetical protein
MGGEEIMPDHSGWREGKMKPRLILGLGVVCLLLGAALSTYLFLNGHLLPSTPCRPLMYPDGEMTTEPHTIFTTDSLESVFQFYDQHLKPTTPTLARMSEWSREQSNPLGAQYGCYNVDYDGMHIETGCIQVSAEDAATKIEISFRRSVNGSTVSCREGNAG